MPFKVLKKLKRLFGSEPPLWAMWCLVGRVLHAIRNRVLSSMLRAPRLNVGPGSVFRGVRYIRFGSSFSAHGAVWIEAVVRYAEQSFTPRLTIGNQVSASNDLHVSCIEQVTIGNRVLFGSRVYVSDHNHGDYRSTRQSEPDTPPAMRDLGGGGPVTIEDNVWIGHNVCIIGPAHIGFGSVIGANSVVRGHVPARSIVAGIPAGVLKQFDQVRRSWEKP